MSGPSRQLRLLLMRPFIEYMGEKTPVGQADGPAGFPQEGREGQGWKEKTALQEHSAGSSHQEGHGKCEGQVKVR